jgi:NitT/TauT family transport system ATP-binding protein
MQNNAVNEDDADRSISSPIPKLEAKNISKFYSIGRNFHQQQQLVVLEDISIKISTGEFICLVGTSGCGKSTLLNILAGLLSPSSGAVFVDGKPVTGTPGSDRGVVFQGYTLYPWLTVAKNIGFGLQFQQMTKAEKNDRVNYFLEVVGLTSFANSYPNQLSGGMKQRVAIARALANQPAVLLMDEPFGALDSQTREQMQEFLLNLWEQTQMTILMITHDLDEAIYLSQRIYLLSSRPGKIQSETIIPLPKHREIDLKLSADFFKIKRKIIYTLRNQI